MAEPEEQGMEEMMEGAQLVFSIVSEAMWEYEEHVRYLQVSSTVPNIVSFAGMCSVSEHISAQYEYS